jgi:hypothetical protein
MRLLLSFVLLAFAIQASTQPLKLDWENDLLGKWQVYKMGEENVPDDAKLFLEFMEDKLLMHNQGRIREAEWKVLDAERKILIRTEEGIESWDLVSIDLTQLSIYDTIGDKTVYFKRFEGEIKGTLSLKTAKASYSDLVGTWLVVTVNGQKTPVSLKIVFNANGQMQLTVAKEIQKANWKLNPGLTEIILVPEGAAPIQWKITEINTDNLSFVDQGDEMRLTRYVEPIMPDKETLLLGKWTIVEVGGNPASVEGQTRFVSLDASGKLTFFTNEKKEGEASWGLSDTRTGIHIVGLESNEYWKILSSNEKELLLEMEGLKMLLKK